KLDVGPDQDMGPCSQTGCTRVDMLFALDSSLSMGEEIMALSASQAFTAIVQDLEDLNCGGIEYRIGLTNDNDGGFIGMGAGGQPWFDSNEMTAEELRAVRGNNDVPGKWPPPHVRLHALPIEQRLELPGGELVVVHGDDVLPASRRHERLRERYPEARMVVYGHSHRLVIDRDARPWIVNPGAAGKARTYGGASACVLVASARRWT